MARSRAGAVLAWVRAWALWTFTPALVTWVVLTVAAAAGVATTGVATTRVRWSELGNGLLLLGCAAACVELGRRVGPPAGIAKDLLSAWTLPVALLLPPVYSLLIPIPLMVLRHLRVGRGLIHRRVFSVASIGLANWVVSILVHSYLGWSALHLAGPARLHHPLFLLVAFGCAVVGCAVNVGLIGGAVRIAAPGTTWRGLLLDREQRFLDLGEICLGVAVTACWFACPEAVLVMVVPVLLVQRSLGHAQLRAEARLDAKTGLLNAAAWQGEADREIVRAHRERQPLAILIADIDRFKRINDTHGHLAGDVALMAAVTALTAGLRLYDQLGRFGGEEFTVVLPRTGAEEAARIAERLRRAVCGVPVLLGDVPVELSVSIGVAVLGDHGHDLTDLLAAADHALYRAKEAGRNQVALAR